jgi:hypothetical protein
MHTGYLRLQTLSECVTCYCFTTATTFTQTRLNVTLYVHCLSRAPLITPYGAVFVCRHPCHIATNCCEHTVALNWGLTVIRIFVKTRSAVYSPPRYVATDDTILVSFISHKLRPSFM